MIEGAFPFGRPAAFCAIACNRFGDYHIIPSCDKSDALSGCFSLHSAPCSATAFLDQMGSRPSVPVIVQAAITVIAKHASVYLPISKSSMPTH